MPAKTRRKVKEVPAENSHLVELSVLYEVSQTLSNLAEPIEQVLGQLMFVLERKMGLKRGTITLLNPQTNELEIQIAHGLSSLEKKRGTYKLGEGITGKVVASGKPMFIPSIGDEPQFLNKTQSRDKKRHSQNSFICVPIKTDKKVLGALSVDKLFKDADDYEEELRFLSIIAAMIAQHVRTHQGIEKQKTQLIQENQKLRQELIQKYDFKNIIGRSHAMDEVFEKIAQVAQSQATVLIRGESGTGKELIAQAIHYNSDRRQAPFIKFSCSAVPEGLLESELFGHVKGSFTGAFEDKVGRFEMAKNGTIFLDEIGDVSLAVQVKLLRVLQEREFERVGSGTTIPCKARVITATNKNLEEAIKKNTFREDLYYRLNVFPIYISPLRGRGSDIDLLVDFFLEKYAKENNKKITRISTEAINLLNSYHWPGNVRELENCIERAVLLCTGDTVQVQHLPPTLQGPSGETEHFKEGLPLKDLVSNFEKELIMDALKMHRGNKSKAALQLKTTERIFGYKVEQYSIDYRIFRK
jgi:Nif-specific regulatory protein